MAIDYWDAERLRAALPPHAAMAALRKRLVDDPPAAQGSARFRFDTSAGELLFMPDESASHVGVKVLSSVPGNPAQGLPLVQGTYLLMDAATNSPVALMDAAELSLIRTAAVTALAVELLSPPTSPRIAIIGSGPQAVAHAEALAPLHPTSVRAVVRSPEAADRLVRVAEARNAVIEPAGAEAVIGADVIVCVTSSPTPVVDDADVLDTAIVAAVGAHQPHTRELPAALMGRAFVAVESRGSALRDSGDVLIAQQELGRPLIDADLAELVQGLAAVPTDRPRVYVSVGESWEDLAIASSLA